MSAQVTLSPWTVGGDETVNVYNWEDQARTDPLDITGRTYRFDLAVDADTAPVLSLTGTVTGASGLAAFVASDTQTAALTVGNYVYAVWETSGSLSGPIQYGTVYVRKVAKT